jgi:hypothetical protein
MMYSTANPRVKGHLIYIGRASDTISRSAEPPLPHAAVGGKELPTHHSTLLQRYVPAYGEGTATFTFAALRQRHLEVLE